jgi:hypothetical protein
LKIFSYRARDGDLMTTPADARGPEGLAMWGGIRDDIQNNVVGGDTAALASVQAAAESGERRRRELAGMTPGVGAQLHLPQPYADAGMGSPPAVGEGYSVESPAAPAQVQVDHGSLVYGRRPVYGDDLIGGVNFQGGRSEPAVRHVHNLGDSLFTEGASGPPALPAGYGRA